MRIAWAVLLVAAVVAAGGAGVRWLRVAQREHYLPGSTVRFARRWWLGDGPDRILGGAIVLGAVLAVLGLPEAGVVAAAGVAVGPYGLGLRGRTSKLAWTRRLRVLAAVAVLLVAAVVAVGGAAGGLRWAAVVMLVAAVGGPALIDLALVVTEPLEARLSGRFVRAAEARLRAVAPETVAVTGSYGKTSTKGYIAHLVGATRRVVASPASFNNRAGLARAVNEHVTPTTEVFVAEMGTYGPGEIAELCSWVRPRISVITAIGPVHLERMRTEERILAAKAEILAGAEVAVLNVDDPRLAALGDTWERSGGSGERVWRCSALDTGADVCVSDGFVWCRGSRLGELHGGAARAVATNLACAVAVALELGVPAPALADRLASLPQTANRLSTTTGATGTTIIDDTYNSNPAGTGVALAALQHESGDGGRRVVVTPGMVELGPRQSELNAAFASAAASVATDLIVVGRTNRSALLAGASGGTAVVRVVATRQDAVAWVRAELGLGDAVLYENDLPDHFP